MSYDEKRYSDLIYDILRQSDLETVSAKKIRNALSERLGYDVSDHKKEISRLIEACFDRVTSENANGTNGASPSPSDSSPQKRKEPSDGSDLSDVVDERPKKKARKQDAEEDDAAYAARLQREENSRARPTRAGATRKAAPVKRKKKSAVKVKDGSDVETNGESKPRTGGFHKPMNLSEPLSALLGETQLSRPQTVKKIWEYVKGKDLQDPADKRQIVCDDAMRAVFKTDRVHMFTMNKILNQNLYAAEDVVATTPAAAPASAPAPSSSPAPDMGSSP
ncbi:SWIB-domain-containing protein [Aureobasidium sp. EXF-12298]|nr:SWIB-domain-containing protein [Aureobasidium sp. EXF-12298]KAI4755796.1 SWIB-domain-containing protein [Aureobasidium sp. EXF-12344]KAI4783550.1 SWIB-domain-containing protein [Aureobasidium sp. EXF-3400]